MANRTFIDLTGRPFGHLTVVGRSDRRDSSNEVMWRCVCACGKKVVRRSSNLRSPPRCEADAQSCGCMNPATQKENLTGLPFGRWAVLSPSPSRRQHYRCRCRCGAEREVYGPSLTGRRSRCCGAAACRAALNEEN